VLPQLADAPDMVYAMNLGLVVGDRAVLSHMRHPERRPESPAAARWFRDEGLALSAFGSGGVGAHFEAGDAFPWRGELLVGYGPRTEELALKHLATELGITVRGFRITHPGMYHMDLSFCPLDQRRALVCPAAYDEASAAALLDLVPEPLVLTEEEALTFCANSVVIGRTVVMPACPERVRARLEDWGFAVLVVGVEEFLKGGGAIRCLTNPLDIALGRDLAPTPGGRVLLP
jgi:N-dimethylarginine dimethylaminohydrolase